MKKSIMTTSILAGLLATAGVSSQSLASDSASLDNNGKTAHITVLAPEDGYVSGLGSRAFLVDLSIQFSGNLASTGVTPELTGPGPQQNVGPFPGTFGLGANLDHFPSLVVLLSSTRIGAGAGQNVSNLFNINTVTNQDASGTEIWSTWIVGAANAFGVVGEQTPSRLFVAVVEGTAPNVVIDMDGNGELNKKDLKLMGYKVISNAPKVDFVVNGGGALN